ncbi:MAG: tRNA lysidine(34) synthetase TilS [Paludibacteraceae bacterium]|nr:tRNA lysidine(34) synthetase TilS [Paludibacteraceae bacterium]
MKYIRRQIQQCAPLQGTRRLLVAVSGGPDSIVLLDALHREGFSVVVAHCNFHLRADASNEDAEFVRTLATKYQLPYCQADFDTIAIAEERKISIEMAARDLRYEWFEQMADVHNCDLIAVAHNADDVVETFFLNLTRGSGLQGLSGMAELRGRVVRPLLKVSRKQIMEYIAEYQLQYRIDATNLETVYTRNKIRHDIVPQFEKLNPSFLSTMHSNMRFIASAQSIVEAYALEAYKRVVVIDNERVLFNLEELTKYQGIDTLLFIWLTPYGFSSDVVMQLYRSLGDNLSGKQFFSATHRVVLERETLELGVRCEELGFRSEEFVISQVDTFLQVPINLEIKTVDISDFELIKSSNVACLDADKLQYPLRLRRWQQGDWFIPFGMKGRKKLSDFFVDKKFSTSEKEQLWLLTSGDDIVWVVGHRVDARYAVTDKTKKVKIFIS